MHHTKVELLNKVSIIEKINTILNVIPQSNLMAVVKYASDELLKELLDDGRIKIIGENRIQDAIKRWGENGRFSNYRNNISLHFIGHLQKNKVKYATKLFDYIDSVDSIELAEEINRKTNKKMPILLQLKINNIKTQYGILPSDFDKVITEIKRMENISLCGIMAIGPITDDENEIRKSFKLAREIYMKYFNSEYNPDGFKNYLSIGMSSDYKIALEEGSNLVRIGSLIFEQNNQK